MTLSSVRPLSALLILVIAFGQCELTRLPPVVHDDQPDDVNLKIVNGHYAEDHSVFPFQAYIFTVSKMRCDQATGMCQLSGSACGGTIVNAQFILTAAHCVKQGNRVAAPSSVRVSVGVDNKDMLDQRQVHLGSEVHVHPAYSGAPLFHNDIAIVKLQRPITFNSGVHPACLNFVDKHYQFLVASGYGTTSTQVQDAQRNQIGTQQPGDRLKYAFFREEQFADDCFDDFICINSYFMNSGDSICMGDSGGPLSTPPNSNTGEMQVLGVASNVAGLQDSDNGQTEFCVGYAKYTRLSNQVSFIDSKIGRNNYCSVRS